MPTEREIAEALEKSIKHWEENKDGEDPTFGVNNCALCKIFYAECCRVCPVRGKTQCVGCEGSPYAEALDAWENVEDLRRGGGENHKDYYSALYVYREACQREIDFLKSLRK